MDIAAGQGRYIFDAINDYGKSSPSARDYSPINVEQGRLHIKNVTLKTKSNLLKVMLLMPMI